MASANAKNYSFLWHINRNCSSCISPTVGIAPTLFASALKFFAASQCLLRDDFKSDTVKDGDRFDFIIIGAGSAGSVVVNRLSEISGWKVLLLEAGSQPPIESEVPQLYLKLYNTQYDWQYKPVNDGKTAQVYKGGGVPYVRGKMLGGCSSINAMLYIRGNEEDYQAWEKIGNPSWNFQNVYDHFKKAESFQNEQLKTNPFVKNTYGYNGPLVLNRFNRTYGNVKDKILDSYDEIGLKKVVDLNAFTSPDRSGIVTVTAANGIRSSTYQTYLLPVRSRKNLKIIINAFVLHILINEDLLAYGVQVNINGKNIKLYANLEIIVSAGTFNTPQLLMLSGIGPKRHLESKNISCKVDLPFVGKNLHDHFTVQVPIFGNQPGPENIALKSFGIIEYLYNRTGLLAQIDYADILSFYKFDKNISYPQFQSLLHVINQKDTKTVSGFIANFNDSVKDYFLKQNENNALYLFMFHLLHPFSRGEILLNTSNPYDKPLINPNYFGDPRDLELTAIGIRRLTKIISTKYFKSIKAFLLRVNLPQCNKYILDSISYWKCQAKNTVITGSHPVGTSKMGPNPKDCVVDNYLKVHNVAGLRIIDASIMPHITSGNINGPTIMVGELGAHMIKSEYSRN